ncbi:MAG: universal stress protein [Allobranchiibius sp.]
MSDLRSKPIVVGFDDHEASRKALLQAVELCTALQVHLHVVHVIGVEDAPMDPDALDWEEGFASRLQQLQEHAQQLVMLTSDGWTYHAVNGNAWQRLLGLSEQVDAGMIVVGQHLHAHALAAAVGRFLSARGRDSVGDSLVHHGGRSILIVTTPDAKPGVMGTR